MAASSVIVSEQTNVTQLKNRVIKFTPSTSYPTGGEPLTAANFNLEYLAIVLAESVAGYVFQYDYAASKLKAYVRGSHTHDLFLNQADVVDGAGTRVNAATNLLGANSGADITVAGVTDSTGHGGVLSSAAAALAEVANATDLSAAVVRILAFGR